MALDPEVRDRLLTAIAGERLVILCGAGLSRPPPSELPSAIGLARACFDRRISIEPELNANLRDRLDLLAQHYFKKNELVATFLRTMLPWDDLHGPPNAGHAAVADLLIVAALRGALSANFDALIETWAAARRFDLRGATTAQQAAEFAAKHAPLIKVHGCIFNRDETIWTEDQLAVPAVAQRLDGIRQWVEHHLPGKDLLVVGFWTDWAYLNDGFATAFGIDSANSVTVVDPDEPGNLEARAKGLWTRLNAMSKSFVHLRLGSDEFLADFRAEFSRAWLRQFAASAYPPGGLPQGIAGAYEALSNDDLYCLRRDIEGVPYSRVARRKNPDETCRATAEVHKLLHERGAALRGAHFELAGSLVRVVNGAGQDVEELRERNREPPVGATNYRVVVAGGLRFGTPPNIAGGNGGLSVVRGSAQDAVRWMSDQEFRTEIGL